MKKKKLTLALVGLLSVVTLAGCSSGKDLVTMKGGKITVDEFFDEIKSGQETQQALTYAIIYKVADQGYGKDVTKEDIQKAYDEVSEQYGDTFKDQLKQANMTEASYKEQLKKSLAFEKMQEAHVDIKEKDLKEAWKDFHPEVETQIIAMDDEKEAKEVLERVKKDEDFGKVAKEKSMDNSSADNGKMKFDSSNQTVPQEAKEAAYKLKDGEISDLITVSTNNGQEEIKVYYIVKMVKNQEKGDDWKKFEKELKEITKAAKLADPAFQQKVISQELKEAKIDIKDDSLKQVLAGYIEEEPKETKKEDTKESKKSEKKEDKKDETKDSKKTETDDSK